MPTTSTVQSETKVLTFRRAHVAARLLEELQAAVPALRPEGRALADGATIRVARCTVSSHGGEVVVSVPPDADEAAIAAVVAAHDGTPLPTLEPIPPPDYGEDAPADYERQLAGAVTSLRAYLSLPAPAPAQTVGTVKLLIRVVLFLSRRAIR